MNYKKAYEEVKTAIENERRYLPQYGDVDVAKVNRMLDQIEMVQLEAAEDQR